MDHDTPPAAHDGSDPASGDEAALTQQLAAARRTVRLVVVLAVVLVAVVVAVAVSLGGGSDETATTTTTMPAEELEVVAGFACGSLRREAPLSHPDSDAAVELSLFVLSPDGQLPSGSELVLTIQGADSIAVGAIERNGLVTVIVPVTGFGDFPVAAASLTSPVAETVDVTEPVQKAVGMLAVGTEEGPLGGCDDPRLLSEAEQDARGELLATDAAAPFAEFVDDWLSAHQERDTAFLLDSLDPVVIGIHGREVCAAHVEEVVGEVVVIEVIDARPETYEYEAAGTVVPVDDAWRLTVDFLPRGASGTARTDMHLRPGADGTITWFTDCSGVD